MANVGINQEAVRGDSPDVLRRQALRLEYILISYNTLEGIIAIAAGWLAGSIALVGFGMDSAIEVMAAVILVWRLRYADSVEEETERERKALFGVGLTFFVLAAYVIYEAGTTLLRHEAPEASWIGIALAVASLIVMPILGLAKRRIALAMGSRALAADAMETLVCAYLSFALLLGLGLNALLGWWWADPLAALAMVWYISKEGWEDVLEAREKGPTR
ncbi:MAG: cation transporter [Acidobacteria bacterium]|nr:cation transporter [Acidobacteriota bacterium]